MTALVEGVGVVGLLAGVKYPRLAVLAGLWLAATMVGAVVAHLGAGDPPSDAAAAAVLLVLSLGVAALRWRTARIGELLAARTRGLAEPGPARR